MTFGDYDFMIVSEGPTKALQRPRSWPLLRRASWT